MELPSECNGHFHVANVRDGSLVIMADSPVWAARLRQLSPQMLAILQQHRKRKLLHVRVFSRPNKPPVRAGTIPGRVKYHREISPESRDLIKQAAVCVDDDGLRAALLKLAARNK